MLIISGMLSALGASTVSGCAQNGYRPDLSFAVQCVAASEDSLRDKFINFLTEEAFLPLDKVKLAQKRGERALFSVDIIGLDHDDRELTLSSMPMRKNIYSIAFVTRPPTQRNEEFEKRIIDFFSSQVVCSVYNISRGINDKSSVGIFNDVLSIYKEWYLLSSLTNNSN